ncbi:hypothetical protein BCR43DRAFT_516510 [Syncephalastrum racemosum]|uniref:Chromatin target of PRMT1 protein C-terminal domain-containing protein n=1 Tax=Syncephalastrum racemosum TaxID=13706 RepID=A0A1X2H8N4_SYNRA|nr:hypothetical protein BCR43DRAFT_516510 [Syncephalastrum racemosum]
MAPYRRPNANSSGRVVSFGGGGLNERFSQIGKGPGPSQPSAPAGTSGSSVFSRLQSNPQGRRNAPTNIQKRLSRPVNAGVQKKQAPAPRQKRESLLPKGGRAAQRGVAKPAGRKPAAGSGRVQEKRAVKGGKDTKQKPKKLSVDDLDKSLDAYMMKDSKTAQSKLDAELDSYMDDNDDILKEL